MLSFTCVDVTVHSSSKDQYSRKAFIDLSRFGGTNASLKDPKWRPEATGHVCSSRM